MPRAKGTWNDVRSSNGPAIDAYPGLQLDSVNLLSRWTGGEVGMIDIVHAQPLIQTLAVLLFLAVVLLRDVERQSRCVSWMEGSYGI